MSCEQNFSEKISENIIEILKKSSFYDKISRLTNKANKTIYGVGGFCLIVTFFTVINYNKTKNTIQFIEKHISNISECSYDKNKNDEIISYRIDNIEKNVDIISNDISEINFQLKNLLEKFVYIHMQPKRLIETSTSTDSLDFLTLENSCRENFQDKSIQTEEIDNTKKEEIFTDCKNIIDDEYNDIMNECYDIIPCNNVKKYVNNNFSLFF
jgi:hypothetical protein